MRTTLGISVLLLIVFFQGCKKAPEACLLVSNETPLVGEPFYFENCSENFKQALFDPNDGNLPIAMTSRLRYRYYFPKLYAPNLLVYNSDENDIKESSTNKIVAPRVPTMKEMSGSWTNFRVVGYDNVFFSENRGVFEAEVKLDTLVNIQYDFDRMSNKLIITDKDSVREASWSRTSHTDIYNRDTTQVIYFHNDSMVILQPYRYGYALGYFAR